MNKQNKFVTKILLIFFATLLAPTLSAELTPHSLVTIKVAGKYVSFQKNDAETTKHGNNLYGNIILSDEPNMSCVFEINKRENENAFSFLALNGATITNDTSSNPQAYLTCDNANKKAIFFGIDQSDDKFFILDKVSGKTDFYNLKFLPFKNKGYLKKTVNEIETGFTETEISKDQSDFQFEIKEITLNIEEKENTIDNINELAQQCLLPGFYRPDLVTIKNVGQNKYLSTSYNQFFENYGLKIKPLDLPTTTRSIFKIMKSREDYSKIINKQEIKKYIDDKDWLHFITTKGTTFDLNGERYWLDSSDNGEVYSYIAAQNPAYDDNHRRYQLLAVQDQKDTYLIYNQQHERFIKATSGGYPFIGEADESGIKNNKDYWFEIKKFIINPNLYLLRGETEQEPIENNEIQFKVKNSNKYFKINLYDAEIKTDQSNKKEHKICEIRIYKGRTVICPLSGKKVTTIRYNSSNKDEFESFWISIKDQKISFGTGATTDKNKKGESKKAPELNKAAYFTFEALSNINDPDKQTYISKTEKPIKTTKPSKIDTKPIKKEKALKPIEEIEVKEETEEYGGI